MKSKIDIAFSICLALLAIVLIVLFASPIARPVSDAYMFDVGIIALVLIAASIALWIIKRK